MLDFMSTTWYKFLVVFGVIPVAWGLADKNLLLSLVLVVCQIPWFYTTCCKDK